MLVESCHDIHNRAAFRKIYEAPPPPPAGLALVSIATRKGETHLTCLWEAASRKQVQHYLDPLIGKAATIAYHELEQDRSGASVRPTPTAVLDDAGPYQLHEYGKRLLREGRKHQALAVFAMNARRHPTFWIVDAGLARGHAALGDCDAAIRAMAAALNRAPAHRHEYVRNLFERLLRDEEING